MADDLNDLAVSLGKLLDNSEPLQHALGQFGKETALEEAQRSLGSDKQFSGMKRKVRLGAGYDMGTPVVLNLRPGGLWILADEGRKRSGEIRPKRRRRTSSGRPPALRTPRGIRSSSRYRPTRGLDTIRNVMKTLDKGIEGAALKGVSKMMEKF